MIPSPKYFVLTIALLAIVGFTWWFYRWLTKPVASVPEGKWQYQVTASYSEYQVSRKMASPWSWELGSAIDSVLAYQSMRPERPWKYQIVAMRTAGGVETLQTEKHRHISDALRDLDNRFRDAGVRLTPAE